MVNADRQYIESNKLYSFILLIGIITMSRKISGLIRWLMSTTFYINLQKRNEQYFTNPVPI